MNQILDHSGPKKPKKYVNPNDTLRIIKVYTILIIVFAVCFFGKAVYSLSENKKIEEAMLIAEQNKEPNITLSANNDILSIDVSYGSAIEEVSYKWYRGNASLDDIHQYESEQNNQSENEQVDENDDEESAVDEEELIALGEINTEKGTGQNQMKLQNIGIPKGDTTIYVCVKTVGSSTLTEYVQNYYTDVGVDKIKPTINAKLQGKTLIITATDETELSYLTYSINDSDEQTVDDVVDGKSIQTEIELSETEDTKIKICAVDEAKNSEIYDKTYELYVSKPKIEFVAESDYSKIYVTVTYAKGLTKVEYVLNGETFEETFDNPEEAKEVNFEVPTVVGRNEITVRAYTEQEEVYSEETGECEYNP